MVTRPLTVGVPNRGRLRAYVASQLEPVTGSQFWDGRELLWDQGGPWRILAGHSRDLPHLLDNGTCDFVVTGMDYASEAGHATQLVASLPVCTGRLAVLGTRRELPRSPRVSTQYPRIGAEWIASRHDGGTIHAVHGAAELYALVSLADLVIDVVATGQTMIANGLVVLETLMETSGAIFAAADRQSAEDTQRVAQLFQGGGARDFAGSCPGLGPRA